MTAPSDAVPYNNPLSIDLPANQLTMRDIAPKVTSMPHPVFPGSGTPPAYNAQMLADHQSTFDSMHNGTGLVSLDDYFGYFNVSASDRDTDYGKSIEDKFRMHDVDGNGVLTVEESQLRCDSHGCE